MTGIVPARSLLCGRGRFILILNDVPEVRELFAWATIETVELSYQAGGAAHTKRVREVVISSTI
jgi:DNA adenine methylase